MGQPRALQLDSNGNHELEVWDVNHGRMKYMIKQCLYVKSSYLPCAHKTAVLSCTTVA